MRSIVKDKAWLVFCVVGAIVFVPAVLIIFLLSDDKRWSVLSNVAEGTLVVFGIIGAIRGFITYGIKKKPLPLAGLHTRLRGGK
jgi:hypothetical protein